ncbi:DUF1304 domain-containing protein [Cryobacterium psychrophilum]|uniref:DUF1304 domain-containing protein n=1 Tax=Cryobacterium psychrophilum TaxID=41988 RepID=A0A4Y8KP70_9MICO|nr:DUF1304 domain-containing protein [Cryobacterium psychrophilum]TDW30288.1 putative membrane protein [Cryobacterium psychrophilum]TFD77505.1 DUF1304 domain-containing protein [Cryobacterium psychrophilum]
MAYIAGLFVALAALLHGYIFFMESLWWARPEVWKRFGVKNQANANVIKPMAYNQGFYNLFLGFGAVFGLGLYFGGLWIPGVTLILFTTACMVLAAIVLRTSGPSYTRAALTQGTLPLVGFILFIVALFS